VRVGEQVYTGQWVFDSRFRLTHFAPDPARYHSLQQHFKGWEIETTGAAFDPQIPTLFDFRTPQKNEMRFFYVLPLSERRALVEYVLLSHEDTTQALKTYIGDVLGITEYRIVAEEGGVNPLTDYPFPRRTGQRVMTIGTPGGRVKPSSGYAFERIQQDSAAIVRSLLQAGHPFAIPPDSPFFGLCDSLLLQVMFRQGEQIKPIFTTMFQKNPIRRIFRFLDGRTSPWESLALMASMPRQLFLAALLRTKVLHRI
jgi:lycopene beta-cyclase